MKSKTKLLERSRLLVEVLPLVAPEKVFALKGGTAINKFHYDLPRLSVDIDLVYLPDKDRAESFAEIDEALNRITAAINDDDSDIRARRVKGGDALNTRLQAFRQRIVVKIETSPVMRGLVHEHGVRSESPAVKEKFGEATLQVAAFEDLYAGKMSAALERQLPRDLFDIKVLYENEGLTDELFRTFLVYATCSRSLVHELLDPNLHEFESNKIQEIKEMAMTHVNIEELREVRKRLVADVQSRLDDDAKRFLLGLYDCEPDFEAIRLPHAATLPAFRWKLLNFEKLKASNPGRLAEFKDGLLRFFDKCP